MREDRVVSSKPLQHYFPWSPEPVSIAPNSSLLRVRFGQATFDAEGTETPGRYFSRHISWPGGQSGVTIGRGYDMGQRTQLQVARELMSAGMLRGDAVRLAAGAGLRGSAAEIFVRNRERSAPVLELSVQQRLFEEITTPEIIADIKRILSKPETIKAYGAVSWGDLPRAAQEFLFDLRYRGDFTPSVRQEIQPLIVQERFDELARIAQDQELWTGRFGVPAERVRARAEILSGALD